MHDTKEYKEGYDAFVRTFNKANPYFPGTAQFDTWERGYLAALLDNAI